MANELDQFKQLPPEPKLWDNVEKENNNADYNKPLKVPLNDQMKKLNEELYWVKKSEEPIIQENTKKFEEKKAPEEQEKLKNQDKTGEKNAENPEDWLKIDENPNTPLIDWFVKQRLLTIEEWEKVKAVLIQEWDLAETIWKIEWIDSEKQTQIIKSINYLDWKDSKKENLENFNKDFAQEIEWLKTDWLKENTNWRKYNVEWDKKWEKELVWQNKDLIEKLGWNYFPIWKEWTKENKNDAQNLAFKRTLNQLMEWKNFKRPETFEQMKDIVKNPELDFLTRFQELCKIDILINNDQSFSSEKQKKSYENWEEVTDKANLSLDKKIAQFKQIVETSIKNKDYEKLKALLQEGKELKKETENQWEVFEWWDIDKLLSEIQETQKEEA